MNQPLNRRDFIQRTLSLSTILAVPALGSTTKERELPNVLIIGDSISIGYTPFVTKLLADKAVVTRPGENCGPTERGVAKLDKWLGDKTYKVIYFNFGLHDLKHVDPVTKAASAKPEDPVLADLPTYKANLTAIVQKLKATGATLVFATTTPVPENSGAPLRTPDMPEKYNQVAKEVMQQQNIAVDDLYAFVLPQVAQWQKPNNVHFTDQGSEALAQHVAASIGKYL